MTSRTKEFELCNNKYSRIKEKEMSINRLLNDVEEVGNNSLTTFTSMTSLPFQIKIKDPQNRKFKLSDNYNNIHLKEKSKPVPVTCYSESETCQEQNFSPKERETDKKPYILKLIEKGLQNRKGLQIKSLHSCSSRPKSKLIFVCEVCDKRFKKKIHLKSHKLKHNREKQIECNICLKRFNHKANLHAHCQNTHNKFTFKCPFCHEDFSTGGYLDIHLNFKCIFEPQIDEAYKNPNNTHGIFNHVETTIKEEVLTPDHNSQLEESKIFLDERIIDNIKEEQDLNNEMFIEPEERVEEEQMEILSEEMKIPAMVKLFKCSKCGRLFMNEQFLIAHMKNFHFLKLTSENFKCHICGQILLANADLINHIKTVHGKPFKCTVCPASFATVTDLTTHKKSHFMCSDCKLVFSSRSSLLFHCDNYHPLIKEPGSKVVNNVKILTKTSFIESFTCKFCDRKFYWKMDYKKHLTKCERLDTFTCKFCPLQLNSRTIYKNHMIMCGRKQIGLDSNCSDLPVDVQSNEDVYILPH